MQTILLLTISNTFTNLAWYGHLKSKNQALGLGSNEWTVPQLKILYECIILILFTIVAFALFRSPVKLPRLLCAHHWRGFLCL